METHRMTVTNVHNGGVGTTTTACRRRAGSRPQYYSSNSKGSAAATREKLAQNRLEFPITTTRNSPAEYTQNFTPTNDFSRPKKDANGEITSSSTVSGDGLPSEAWALFAHADRTDYWLMGGGILAAIVSGSSLPSINIVFADAVTALNNNAFLETNGVDMDGITACGLTLVGIGFWILFSEFLTVALLTHSAARQTRVMREAVMEALVYQEIGWFDESNPFSLSSDIGGNMVVIQEGLGRKLGQFFKHTTQVLLAMTVGIMRGWNVGLGIAATLPVFMVAIYLFVTFVGKSTNLESDEYSKAGAVAEESLASVGTVLSLNAQQTMSKRFSDYLTSGDNNLRKYAKIIASAIAVIQFASFVLFGFGLWLGGHLVAAGNSVVPTMKAALPAIMVEIAGLLAIGSAAPALEALAGAKTAAVFILQIEKQRSTMDCRRPGRELAVVDGKVEFKDVVFAYPTRPNELVLKCCSFVIQPGQKVALVGPSGGGKSTLFSLIERLYDPVFGRIEIDGHDLRALGVKWLRNQFGVVRQEPVLFATSVMENIRYGYKHATDEQVIEAARKAHADGFISGLPDGYNTNIGANGSLLSTGQRQRLAIARAFIKNPPILLLDEVTVALDSDSVETVERAFDELVRSARITTLVIAHRLTTIASADMVFVVEDGKITEQGTYEQIANDPNSRYTALFRPNSEGSEQTKLTEMNVFATSRYKTTKAVNQIRQSEYNQQIFATSFLRPSMSIVRMTDFDENTVSQYNSQNNSHHAGRQQATTGFVNEHQLGKSGLYTSNAVIESPFFIVRPDSVASSRPSDTAWLENSRWRQTAAPLLGGGKDMSRPTVLTADGTVDTQHSQQYQQQSTPPPSGLAKKIFALMAADKKYLILAMATSFVNGVTNPITAILKSNIVNDMYAVEAKHDYEGLRGIADKYLFLFLGAGAVLLVSYWMQSYNFRLLGRNLTNRMRSLTFQSMLHQNLAWFDLPSHSAGALSAMLSNDTAAVKIIAGEIQGRKLQNLIVIALATVLAFIIGSWQATLIFFAVIPLIVLTVIIDQRTSWYTEEAGDRSLATAGRIANEIIHNVQTITENNLQEVVLAEYRKSLDLPTRVTIKTGYSTGLALGVGQFLKWIGYAALHYFSAFFIKSEQTTFALFYRSMNLMNVAALCIDETAAFIGDEKVAKIAAGRIFQLIENNNSAGHGEVEQFNRYNEQGGFQVAFVDVDFAYPLTPDILVLSQYTMDIPANKLTVVQGGSDGGKTTALHLLLRLYDITSGAITIDGHNIEEFSVQALRSQIAIVHQDPLLFRMSVLDNIRLGCSSATMEEVEEVCHRVNAQEFIQQLPEGYRTLVDTSKFSRGQRQRIALARALLQKPRLLLLDEATSALDGESRAIVAETLVPQSPPFLIGGVKPDDNTQPKSTMTMTMLAVTKDEELITRAAQILTMAHGHVVKVGV